MSYECRCQDGNLVDTNDCGFCNKICLDNKSSMESCVVKNNAVLGFTVTMILLYFLISVILFLLVIWFSAVVIQKCNGRPAWLAPPIVTLLVLWFILGWVPGVGVAFFLVLLIVLVVFYNRCGGCASRKKNK